jgi:hypothetical protein
MANIEGLSNAILALRITLQNALLVIIVVFLVVFTVSFMLTHYKNRLLANAAGKKRRSSLILVSITETFGKIGSVLIVVLPVIVAAGLILGVTRAVASVNEFVEREKQIKTLSIAVNFLNQSDKVLDIRVRSIEDNITTIRIDYRASNPNDSSVAPVEWTKTISVSGTELHFDCVVFNFSYSEIGAGRQRNIAIPYRVFSNAVAAADGVKLFEDADSIAEEDDYGFIPAVYREQVLKLLTDADFAREMGVRSVNGSDVWRAGVRVGDRFRVKVEQSGGLTLENVASGGL